VLRHLDISDALREAVCWLDAAAAAAVAGRSARLALAGDALQPTPNDVIAARTRKSTPASGHVRRPGRVASERRHGNSGRRRPVLMTRRPRPAVATGNRRRGRAAVTQRRRQRDGDVTGGW